jgi:hypothetical protein
VVANRRDWRLVLSVKDESDARIVQILLILPERPLHVENIISEKAELWPVEAFPPKPHSVKGLRHPLRHAASIPV